MSIGTLVIGQEPSYFVCFSIGVGTTSCRQRLRVDMESPNPISVAFSVIRAMRVSRPAPSGADAIAHDQLRYVLDVLAGEGVVGLSAERGNLDLYRKTLEATDPNTLSRPEALAYWINLYNAGALDVAAEAVTQTQSTVLRVPGAFSRVWATVGGESLSLNDIEHGKIRRFGDPRIHGALVCGSASCPTLRYEPYAGNGLDDQLDSQMRSFLSGGGAALDTATNKLLLSRIFLWYGADFVRPQRMPTWIPATKRSVAKSIASWLEPELRQLSADAGVAFQSYDWGLSCSIGQARSQ